MLPTASMNSGPRHHQPRLGVIDNDGDFGRGEAAS